MGISQFSMVSRFSPRSRLISFLLLSSADDALCLGLTLVGEFVSLRLLATVVGLVAGLQLPWSANRRIPNVRVGHRIYRNGTEWKRYLNSGVSNFVLGIAISFINLIHKFSTLT